MFSPPPDTGFIERIGVAAQLSAVPRPCILYIHAPAGFGKTTAAAQWLAGHSSAWFTPDSHTAGAARFFRGVLTALSAEAAMPESLGTFLDAVQTIKSWPAALVIDDFHHAADPDVLSALPRLRARMPGGTSLTLISRTPPPLLMNGGLLRTVTGIAFSRGEISALFRKKNNPVTDYAAGLLLSQTGGCAAVLADISGGAGYPDFEIRESIERYVRSLIPGPAPLEQLVKCAVCGDLTPALCAAVTGSGETWAAAARIAGQTGLLTALPGGALRLHPLLRGFLESELARESATDKASLYTAAALSVFESGDGLQALKLAAKSGDMGLMERVSRAPAGKKSADMTDCAAFAEEHLLPVPAGVIRRYPNLCRHCFTAALLTRPAAESGRWADMIGEELDSWEEEDRASAVFVLTADTRYSGWRVPELLGRVRAGIGTPPPLTAGFPFFHRSWRDFTDISRELPAFIDALTARTENVMGHLSRPLAQLIEAGVRYERGELAQAEQIVQGLLSARLPPDILFCVHALYGEMRRVQGKPFEPERIGEAFARGGASARNNAAFWAEAEIIRGDQAAAEIWLGREETSEPVRLHNLYRRFVTARALLVSGRIREAEALLERLAAAAWERRRNADFIQAHTLLSVCAWRMKKPEAAIEAAVPALDKAAELALVMPVAREGGDILPVLQRILNRMKYGYEAGRADKSFLMTLFRHAKNAALHGAASARSVKPVGLSPRQTEVLRCLERGMSYREIAQSLGITTATVDDHIRKLHEKLNASNTREALQRAWELGL